MTVWEICLILWAISLVAYLISVPIAIKTDNEIPMYVCMSLLLIFVVGQLVALALDI